MEEAEKRVHSGQGKRSDESPDPEQVQEYDFVVSQSGPAEAKIPEENRPAGEKKGITRKRGATFFLSD